MISKLRTRLHQTEADRHAYSILIDFLLSIDEYLHIKRNAYIFNKQPWGIEKEMPET